MFAFLDIDGVAKILFPYHSPYEVIVYKGSAFRWDEVEPHVIDVFRRVLGWGNREIEIKRGTMYEHMRDENGRLKPIEMSKF